MKILILDPGNTTGFLTIAIDDAQPSWKDCTPKFISMDTVAETPDHRGIWALLQAFLTNCMESEESVAPIIIYETFGLYTGVAKSMAGNIMYPCEVIGVLKYFCGKYQIDLRGQPPSVKRYVGDALSSSEWKEWIALTKLAKHDFKLTEHVKDCYQHWKYFLRQQQEAEYKYGQVRKEY